MLNLRCSFCQTPYTLSRLEMLDALQEMDAHQLTHYDAHCPRCRRATQIPRQRLEMAMPNWRDALKQFEAEMKEHPQHEAPLPTHEPAPESIAESAPKPVAAEEKPAKRSRAESRARAAATTSPNEKKESAKKSAVQKKSATASKAKKRNR